MSDMIALNCCHILGAGFNQVLRRNLRFYVHRYGDQEFGLVTIPTSRLQAEIRTDQQDIAANFGSFDD